MDLTNANYNRTRNTVSLHGKEYTVKKQRGRYYIHAGNKQITVTDIVNKPRKTDYVFDYIFNGGSVNFPCPAMDYWVLRWRQKIKISISDYKKQYLKK